MKKIDEWKIIYNHFKEGAEIDTAEAITFLQHEIESIDHQSNKARIKKQQEYAEIAPKILNYLNTTSEPVGAAVIGAAIGIPSQKIRNILQEFIPNDVEIIRTKEKILYGKKN